MFLTSAVVSESATASCSNCFSHQLQQQQDCMVCASSISLFLSASAIPRYLFLTSVVVRLLTVIFNAKHVSVSEFATASCSIVSHINNNTTLQTVLPSRLLIMIIVNQFVAKLDGCQPWYLCFIWHYSTSNISRCRNQNHIYLKIINCSCLLLFA